MLSLPLREAEPDLAVPAGRLPYDIGADTLLLHTVQTMEAFDALTATGTLRPDPAKAAPTFVEHYEWMLRMMAARLPTVGDAALWFWARTRRRDLVGFCRLNRGSVLITCRVPRERVLLSHYHEWHAVLNGWLAVSRLRLPGESEESEVARWQAAHDEFNARLEKAGVRFEPVNTWPPDLRSEVERSWELIFEPTSFGRFEPWQATTHALHADDVVEAVRLV